MIERADKLNNQALILASKGNYKDAIACLQRAVTIDNDNHLVWYNLGVTYRNSGDMVNAINSFRKAHELNYYDEEILEALGTTCMQANKIQDALNYCYEGIEINSENPHFWNLLGVVHFKSEQFEKASDAFQNAVILNPYYEDAIFNLRDTYSELKNEKGVAECQKRLNEL